MRVGMGPGAGGFSATGYLEEFARGHDSRPGNQAYRDLGPARLRGGGRGQDAEPDDHADRPHQQDPLPLPAVPASRHEAGMLLRPWARCKRGAVELTIGDRAPKLAACPRQGTTDVRQPDIRARWNSRLSRIRRANSSLDLVRREIFMVTTQDQDSPGIGPVIARRGTSEAHSIGRRGRMIGLGRLSATTNTHEQGEEKR